MLGGHPKSIVTFKREPDQPVKLPEPIQTAIEVVGPRIGGCPGPRLSNVIDLNADLGGSLLRLVTRQAQLALRHKRQVEATMSPFHPSPLVGYARELLGSELAQQIVDRVTCGLGWAGINAAQQRFMNQAG